MRRRSISWSAIAALCVLTLGACATPNPDASTPEAQPVRLTVFAAQSLAESFTAIARAFEAQEAAAGHPGVSVELSLGGSSALATQIEEGAPADVFASADLPQLERLARQGLLAGPSSTFARNTPVLIVPRDNRARIEGMPDLTRPGLRLVLYPEDVPIGHYSRQVLGNLSRDSGDPSYQARVLVNVVSLEPNVRAALAKVELGEADATIVYRTDAATTQAVRVIDIPAAANVVADYPIAALASSKQPRRALAGAFLEFVRGPEGQRLLRQAGFEPPP